jgi:metal-responsive CopG/Arc/MetJ family transcriptional regulator
MTHVVRTHVIAPKELIDEVDKLVGHRRRSEFIVEAAAEKLQREHRLLTFIFFID